jgi:hypothetical protein
MPTPSSSIQLFTRAEILHSGFTGDVIRRIEDQRAHDFLRPYDDLISASRHEYKSYALWRRPFFLPEAILAGTFG